MKYQVIEMEYLPDLVEAVNDEINKGWRPLGGIAVSVVTYENERKGGTETDRRYAQSMELP